MCRIKLIKWLLLVAYLQCVYAESALGDGETSDENELKRVKKDNEIRDQLASYSDIYADNGNNFRGYGSAQPKRGNAYGGYSYGGANPISGRGYDKSPNAYMNSWMQKSQYPSPPGLGIKSPPKKMPTTSIMLPYSGCPSLALPPHVAYQCKGHQCDLMCAPQYSFPNGDKVSKANCLNGKWNIQGQTDGNVPHCQPICNPPCQNNGICWEPGRCKCPENFSGLLCETKSSSFCSSKLPLPKNSRVQCKNDICNAMCMRGFQFPDGSNIANIICQDGKWIHKATGSAKIPDCAPTCTPACMNSGQCVSFNICQCGPKYRGDHCQYDINRCNITNNGFNGNFKCSYDREEAKCSLACPEVPGLKIEGNIDLDYSCKYTTGEFIPKPVPKCIIPDEYIIRPSATAEYYQEVKSPIIMESSIRHEAESAKIRAKLLELIAKYQKMKDSDEWWSSEEVLVSPGNYQLYQTGSVNVIIDRTPKKSSCVSWSGSNIKTFDGLVYKTPLSCSNTFVTDVSDATFDVKLRACPAGSGFGCPHELDIYWQSVVYTLKNINGTVKLSTPSKDLSIPVQVLGIKIVAAAQNIHVTLDTIGLQIEWDRHQYLAIHAGPELWQKIGGLCGSLDGDAENDFISKSGVRLQTVKAFVDSWKVDDKSDLCFMENERELDFSVKTCDYEKRKKGLEVCARLLANDKLNDCIQTFNYAALLQNCVEDYCHCTDRDHPEKCNCQALAMLAEECTFQGIELKHGWRDLEICPISCSYGRIYMSCGPDVEPTCDSAIIPTAGKCVEGCFCPTGTVQYKEACISTELCPCSMKGREFKPESVVKKQCNTCVCKSGKWNCTDEQCTARCGAVGDPHYQTFDGKRYNFMGKCSYYLLKTDNMTVEAENVACSGAISENLKMEVTADDPSCTKSVTIRFTLKNGEQIVIKLNQGLLVQINGEELSKFPKILGRGEVLLRQASSEFITVEFPKGLRIYWDGVSRVYVDAPPSFRDKTSGLCGTFNSNTQDDFLTPEGDIETAVEPFADKWRTKDTCDFPARTREGPHPCSVDVKRREQAEKYCAWILDDIFEECHWTVEPEQYYEDCLYDVCACKEEFSKCFCPLISAYGDECSRQGVKTGWRSKVKDCATKCPLGQVYDECGQSCTRSCEDISFKGTCNMECIEGCHCPPGTYINDKNECVPKSKCHCTYDGISFKPGYKEVRSGSKGWDLCTCENAIWQCQPATPEDEKNFPPAAELRHECSKSENAEFSKCTPLEPKTCKNMDTYVPDLKDCKPGCVCLPDYVLDIATKTCVLPNNCSCQHAGKSYSDGEQMKDKCNFCMCQSGRWECSKKVCESTCSVWGDSHFTTFDNHEFDFQGACDYILSKGVDKNGNGFTITVQNVLCGTLGVTCSKSVQIAISGSITDSILLNAANNVYTPEYNKSIVANLRDVINAKTHAAFHIYKSGVFIVVEVVQLGLQIKWDEGTRVYVKLSKEWKEKVSGLCGNYNDNSMDDMKTPAQSLETSSLIFGHSWKVQNFCSQPTQPIDACKEHPERETWAQLKCGILKSDTFKNCHNDVPVEPYLKRCMFDACACDQGGDCECLCTAVAAYAHACSQKDISIRWRTTHFCPMQCDAHCADYDACTPACGLETCDNFLDQGISARMCNQEHCIEGCKVPPCEEGMIYKNDSYLECVPKAQCKPVCLISNGTTYYEGDIMYQDQCATCHCTKKREVCSGVKCIDLVPTHKPVIFSEGTTENPLNGDSMEPQCVQGWTRWYDKDADASNMEIHLNDEELLPQYDRFESIYGTCAQQYMKKIECRVVNSNKSSEYMEENVDCSLAKGLTCVGKCHDYEIRVYCQCFEELQERELTTENPTIGIMCDNMLAEYKEYPGDCHKFLHCQPKSVNGDWHYVEKTCGDSMMFNPTINVCDHISVVQQIKPSCGINDKEINTPTECPEGMIMSNCANQCENTCHYYNQILYKRGLCKQGEHCKPGCVPNTFKDCHALGKYWLKENVCVDIDECACMDGDEKYVQPHMPVVSGDTACQCLSNSFNCIMNDFMNIEATTEIPLIPHFENLTVFPTTLTPPLTCDSENLVPLVDGKTPLSDDVFSASSVLSAKHAAKFSRLSSKSNSWSPKINDQMQYLQISFEQPTPLFGVKISGNPKFDNYVTLFKILYSYDGEAYHYLVDETDGPQLFNGPIDSRESIATLFKIPVEAKSVRIYPLKWHGSIALRAELMGCQYQETSTVEPRKPDEPKTLEKLVDAECNDPMGIENDKLHSKQLRVSSVFKKNSKVTDLLKLSSPIGWRPLLNTKNEFIEIDFLEARNISGLITKGGPDGWVTGFKVLFSKNKILWNKVQTNSGQPKIFVGNHDSNTEELHIFNKPILTRYLKIVPAKWERNINMRTEILGCFIPYLEVKHESTPVNSPKTKCLFCEGIYELHNKVNATNAECKCTDGLYFDGNSCVTRNLCPCVENYVPYVVGAKFENKECEECVCLLGGYSSCKPKKCPPCSGQNVRPVISSGCYCKCEPCPKEQKLCPSSGDCIPEMLWCNGIHDCADDEDASCQDKFEVKPNVEKNETTLSCPEPKCPPNMKLKLIEKKAPEMSTMFTSTTTRKILMTSEGHEIKKTKIVTSSEEFIALPGEEIDMLEEKLCDEFACIPISNGTQECPLPKCPENYDIEVDMSNNKPGDCGKYFCTLKPRKDDVCEISGSSFTTFDSTEFKYNLCSHILARDITNTQWIISVQVHCETEIRRVCRKSIIIEDLKSTANLTIMPNLKINFNGFEYTVQQLINSPICKASFVISKPGNTVLVVSQRHGFWVSYDDVGYVKIGMSSKYIKTVVGLCGYYNGKANDDKRAPNGTLMPSTVEFGDSWYNNKVPKEQCQRHTCPLDLQKKSLAICNTIKHPTFLKCGKSVNYKQYVSKCIETVCECLQANNEDVNACKCTILQNFVKKCLTANPNVQLNTWRAIHQCEISCPTPLVHSDCYKRRCELSCNAFNSDDCPIIPDACFAGCYCPEGTVRKDDTCVSVNECKDCECYTYGPEKYFTYDHNNFTFEANCTYLLSRDIVLPGVNTFQIYVTMDDCWSLGYTHMGKGTTKCAKAYHVLHGDHIVHLTRSSDKLSPLQITVDGFDVPKLPYKDSWLNLRTLHAQKLFLSLTNAHAQLSLDFEKPHFSFEVPSIKYGSKMEGLCGNCNGNPSDDLQANTAKVQGKKSTQPTVRDVVQSWQSDEPRLGIDLNVCKEQSKIELPSSKCTPLLPGEVDPCLKMYDQTLFGKCHLIVDPSSYVEACQQDTCKYGRMPNTTCNAFVAYNQECKRNGVCVDWRGPDLCPYVCPTSNMIYKPCACAKTCETVLAMHEFDAFNMNTSTFVKTIDDSDMCDIFQQTEGCFCARGQVLENGRCIAEELCVKCQDGQHVPGEKWQKDKCTTCECNKVGKIECLSQQCLVEENICAEGFTPKKIVNAEECCAKFICVPVPKLPPAKLCLAPLMPVCGPGQYKEQKIGADGCPQYICVCKPKEECEKLEVPRNLKPGEKLVIEEQGCCATQKIVCNKNECPKDIMQCSQPYYKPVLQDEPNSCCPTYTCQLPKDKCIVNDVAQAPIVKNLFEKWTHPTDPCKLEVCNYGANGTAQVQTTIETCDTQCAYGYTYVPGNSSTCCGQCVQTACVYESKLYKPDEVWHSTDNCTLYKCDMSTDNLLIVTSMKEACPDISDCAPDQIIDDGGCCKYCKSLPLVEDKSLCLPVSLAENETVNLVKIFKHGHGYCINVEPIKGFTECSGACASGSKYNSGTLTFDKNCDCCSIISYSKLAVPLVCENDFTWNYEIEIPSSCGCRPCIDSATYDLHPQFDVRLQPLPLAQLLQNNNVADSL